MLLTGAELGPAEMINTKVAGNVSPLVVSSPKVITILVPAGTSLGTVPSRNSWKVSKSSQSTGGLVMNDLGTANLGLKRSSYK